jgi:nucleoside-diphosphate-sugar epimerase
MYFNLVNNKDHFGKLITFGSGSQYYLSDTPHGKSKAIINESVKNNFNFYDLRIFGVFDENELPTRFIKANITRYIKKEPMIIHTNKIMDFIYMQDLISTVEYYINNADPIKDINCCYEEKYTLKTIANMINSLDSHKVPIVTENENQLQMYCGESGLPPINIIGLRQGIQNTFRALST